MLLPALLQMVGRLTMQLLPPCTAHLTQACCLWRHVERPESRLSCVGFSTVAPRLVQACERRRRCRVAAGISFSNVLTTSSADIAASDSPLDAAGFRVRCRAAAPASSRPAAVCPLVSGPSVHPCVVLLQSTPQHCQAAAAAASAAPAVAVSLPASAAVPAAAALLLPASAARPPATPRSPSTRHQRRGLQTSMV